jgi:putative ABC transport system substrate-binding protein
LAAEYKIPAIYNTQEFTLDGGLISCGPAQEDAFSKAGGYVARILKGTKPTDLPIQQAVRFELIINLQTAKALTVSPTLLARADVVIAPSISLSPTLL